MNATLPHGLITISHTSVSDDTNFQYSDVLFERMNVLNTFWKVHAVRHKVSKDASDFRSQNLFWRTWGNPKLSRTITTSTLTLLWSSCQQPVDISSLRRKVDLPPFDLVQKPFEHSQTTFQGRAVKPPSTSFSTDYTSSSQGSPRTRTTGARKISLERRDELGSTINDNKKISKLPRPALYRANSSSNRTSFTASTSKTKNRPSLNRRKSSQGVVPVKPTRTSKSVARSPNLSSREIEKPEILPCECVDQSQNPELTWIATPTTSTFELPSASSWEDDPVMDLNQLSRSNSTNHTPSELVEPNFRHKFAERVASSNNLAGLGRMKKTGSVVRFADEIPADLQKVRTNESGTFVEDERRSSLLLRSSNNSIAVIDEDDMLPSELPRSKSQLSILLAENRCGRVRQSTESIPYGEHVGLSSRRKRDPTDYEKVLAMAHNDGVTKAGGRQIRRGFKMSHEDESRYSSPSPPPLF